MRQAAGPVIVCLLFASVMTAQTGSAPVTIPQTEHRQFTSAVNGRTYSVSVALPADYGRDSAKRYTALYFGDANLTFGMVTETYRLLRLVREIDELILVGVSSSDFGGWQAARMVDYTPTRDITVEATLSKRFGQEVRVGGAEQLLRVLTDEIIPDTERRYRTAPGRAYFGASLSGLFGAYVLFQSPQTFERMILVSPSLDWDNRVMFKAEAQYAERHKTLRTRLFVSAAELEAAGTIGDMRQFATVLSSRKHEGLSVQSKIFEGETHFRLLVSARREASGCCSPHNDQGGLKAVLYVLGRL